MFALWSVLVLCELPSRFVVAVAEQRAGRETISQLQFLGKLMMIVLFGKPVVPLRPLLSFYLLSKLASIKQSTSMED